jgi:hypothetical protein
VPLPAWRRRGRIDPGLLAVAGAFARGSLRTVQGKVTVVVPALAGAALAVIGEAQGGPLGPWVAHGPALLAVVAFLSLTTGQNVLLNQFGVDRSGLALELLLPLTARQLLLGRALGCALLTAASFLPALVAVVLAGGGRSPLWLAAVVLGLAGAFAVFFLVAAWLSLLFPKPANLAKLSQEGKPRPAAVLLGFLGLLVTLALPAGAGFAGLLAGGAAGALAAEALFAAGALALFPPLLARTAAALELRRDAIYLAMREG